MNLHHLTDWLLAPQYLGWLWDGFLLTLWISACTVVASTLLGFLLAAARDSENKVLQWFAMGYSTVFRNTPLLIQLFLVLCGEPNFTRLLDPLAQYPP